ncbi:hypothetical protein T11_6143 [Trichinella zimbabwensis]|uniref:Uncharacterized protein n=1 Tax=Trichinella zimbabwensis TaxID=268475 RepID=A0A0V1HWD0_9BILA|nr:hypothetical protein T11_6143 [Trichinella zimbabwensis]
MEIIFNSLPVHDSNELLLNEHDEKSMPHLELSCYIGLLLHIVEIKQQRLDTRVNQTRASTVRSFWISNGTSAVEEVQLMHDLPSEGTETVGPYVSVGVKFAAPILARDDRAPSVVSKT